MLSELGTSGRGGGFDDADVCVAVGAGAVLLPVKPGGAHQYLRRLGCATLDSPTEALVAPPLRSHGLGGEGDAILQDELSLTSPSSGGWRRRWGRLSRGRAMQKALKVRAGRPTSRGRAGLGWAWRRAPKVACGVGRFADKGKTQAPQACSTAQRRRRWSREEYCVEYRTVEQ